MAQELNAMFLAPLIKIECQSLSWFQTSPLGSKIQGHGRISEYEKVAGKCPIQGRPVLTKTFRFFSNLYTDALYFSPHLGELKAGKRPFTVKYAASYIPSLLNHRIFLPFTPKPDN